MAARLVALEKKEQSTLRSDPLVLSEAGPESSSVQATSVGVNSWARVAANNVGEWRMAES